jgi:hypothetical protein
MARYKTFKDYSFLAKKTRNQMNIFDIDDTIVVTKSAIKVTDHKTGEVISLTPKEFNDYEKEAHHELDFTDFQDAEILRAGKIIDWVFKILKDTLKKSKAVGVITARDDAKLIRDFLLENGVDINPDFIYAVNDPELGLTGTVAEKKKQALKRLIDMGFTDFKFFDDAQENLDLAKSVENEIEGVKIKTTHIKQKWIPKI